MATQKGAAAGNQAVWDLVEAQHGVVARWQLLELGFTGAAIRHRVRVGRLHPVYRGVYAVGRRQLTRRGRWMAAVLACGPGAVLSHESAAALLGLRDRESQIEVSVPRQNRCRRKQVRVHQRGPEALTDAGTCHRIPVTSPVRTLVDLAAGSGRADVERLINQADKLDLIDPDSLRGALGTLRPQPGVAALCEVLDEATFVLTETELERLFVPLARRAGLPKPQTQRQLEAGRVDFHWPELGLVVETDGLRYHRTPTQQARDIERDNAHRAAGLVPVRFTHGQVRHRPRYVERTLAAIARNVTRRGDG